MGERMASEEKKKTTNKILTVNLYQTLLDNTEKWKENVQRETKFWYPVYDAHLRELFHLILFNSTEISKTGKA